MSSGKKSDLSHYLNQFLDVDTLEFVIFHLGFGGGFVSMRIFNELTDLLSTNHGAL